jgi:hypothetical protein
MGDIHIRKTFPSPLAGEGLGSETRVSVSMLSARRTASRCNGMRTLQGRGQSGVTLLHKAQYVY